MGSGKRNNQLHFVSDLDHPLDQDFGSHLTLDAGDSNKSGILESNMTPLSFLCRLRSIAARRDHFVRRLSVCPVVTLLIVSCDN